MSRSARIEKAEYLLKTMLFDPSRANQLGVYAWASEAGRWNELVTIIIGSVCDQTEDDIRELTQYLSDLGHLDVENLAGIPLGTETIDRNDEEAARIVAAFKRRRVPEEQAWKALTSLCQIARKLSADFGAKIQRYLRHYGDIMLRDAPTLFALKGLGDEQIRRIFTRWLQKVMNVPVLLVDRDVVDFCKKHDIDTIELLEAADAIDMNVAIVDELVKLETIESREQSGPIAALP